MAASDYRGYLRDHADTERVRPRPRTHAHRPLIFATLAVMGALQVASSVAILLHLTGHLREVDLSSPQYQPLEEVRTEPLIAEPKKRPRFPKQKKVPAAHLPVRGPTDFSIRDEKAVMVHWNANQGHLMKIQYKDGRILLKEDGLYYVYAKTCFRLWIGEKSPTPQPDVSNAQLIQYVYHEKHTQSMIRPILIMKSGSTVRWDNKKYHFYCVQQGRGVHLSPGDALFVNVSSSWLLDPEPEASYFGALKLGN
ncbi:tumor necrosis factor ligand superfamily member 11 isoform X2 [Denticeps clupeoides]|uniref:THD domain-containing protein n=1 Tax=Denticeps clupeoides TaxID=299321 RepID=A0AAY4BJ78_9TELE|nr:tumor necrosis factor ligand superfamily member 11-like isoform X2 [Denticeps clupeoides]